MAPECKIILVPYQNAKFFNIDPYLVIALPTFLNIFASFFEIGSWVLFCIASHIVIALPTITTAIVVALLSS